MPPTTDPLTEWITLAGQHVPVIDGRPVLPPLAGAEEPDEAAKAAATAKAAEDAKAAAEAEAAKKAEEDKVREALNTEAGKKALDDERSARKAAEKEAKEHKAKLDAIETEKLSETEKLKKQADDDKAAATTATDKLRRAHLLVALADLDLTGGRAKAAAKLLEVEYDDEDEPKDLDKAIEAAKKTYGDDIFTGTPEEKDKRRVTVNGREGVGDGKGPVLDADNQAMAERFGMTAEEWAQYSDPDFRPPVKQKDK